MIYQDVIIKREQAFCHLLLYFSLFEDETFEGEETLMVFTILQSYSFTASVDFPEEVNLFFDYKNEIENERDYFAFLVNIIMSDSSLVILFHAAQVAMSDAVYSDTDEASLLLLRDVLNISETEGSMIIKLAREQRILKLNGSF